MMECCKKCIAMDILPGEECDTKNCSDYQNELLYNALVEFEKQVTQVIDSLWTKIKKAFQALGKIIYMFIQNLRKFLSKTIIPLIKYCQNNNWRKLHGYPMIRHDKRYRKQNR